MHVSRWTLLIYKYVKANVLLWGSIVSRSTFLKGFRVKVTYCQMFPERIASIWFGPFAAPGINAPRRGGLEPGQMRVRRRVRHCHQSTIIHFIQFIDISVFAPLFSCFLFLVLIKTSCYSTWSAVSGWRRIQTGKTGLFQEFTYYSSY